MLFFGPHLLAAATEITWQANDEQDNDPAKTAPRSQKYWDEHNIQRPDYAKTDTEIWAEKGHAWWMHPAVGFTVISFVIGMAVGLLFLHQTRQPAGDRLGGGNMGTRWNLDDEALEDKIRSARLERFQSNAPKED
jgi:hypothetical protein